MSRFPALKIMTANRTQIIVLKLFMKERQLAKFYCDKKTLRVSETLRVGMKLNLELQFFNFYFLELLVNLLRGEEQEDQVQEDANHR